MKRIFLFSFIIFLTSCSVISLHQISTPTQISSPTPTQIPTTSNLSQYLNSLSSTPENLTQNLSTINWDEAKYYVGERKKVCGEIKNIYYAKNSAGKPTFIDMGNPYPSNNRFRILIWEDYRDKFLDIILLGKGKIICISGFIEMYQGIPQIEAFVEGQIKIQR
ncbi:MAG: hypothetical protein GYA60_06715 [Candidatus Methanofastidiosa archaeon]|nr:hypothetical protein [Candidatus Methanofastidiosa archaeon]